MTIAEIKNEKNLSQKVPTPRCLQITRPLSPFGDFDRLFSRQPLFPSSHHHH
jgi:hypothetical protein